MTVPPTSSAVFACDMSALTTEQRAAHTDVMRMLFGEVVAIAAIECGYSFGVPAEPDTLARVGEFMALERLCCPFFDFVLHVPSSSDVATLQISGPAGVEPFIQAEFGHVLPADVTFSTAPAP